MFFPINRKTQKFLKNTYFTSVSKSFLFSCTKQLKETWYTVDLDHMGKLNKKNAFFLTVPCSNQSLKRNLPPQPVIRQILNIRCREGGVEEKHIPDYPPRNADRHHTC